MFIYSSFQIISVSNIKFVQFFSEQNVCVKIHSRGDRIRTYGLFVPNEARYRAALHPEKVYKLKYFKEPMTVPIYRDALVGRSLSRFLIGTTPRKRCFICKANIKIFSIKAVLIFTLKINNLKFESNKINL